MGGVFPGMKYRDYNVKDERPRWSRNKGQHPRRRPSIPLILVMLFLLVALVAFFRAGYIHPGRNDLSSPGGNFLPPGQAFPPPKGQKGEDIAAGGWEAGDERKLALSSPAGTVPAALPPGMEEDTRAETDDPAGSGPDQETPAPTAADYPPGGYDYLQPVPAADVAVTDDYFEDAVFIGDSRTAGLQKFGGPREATYYTANGLKVDTFFTKEFVETKSGGKITVNEALQQQPFQKAYIMLGINELGWVYSDLFIKKYGEVIDAIRKSAPQAQIYVQSLLPVSKERSLRDKIYNNANIAAYNALIQQMAAEKNLYYLDVAQCVADQEGNLAADASTDGIHLHKAYCDLWFDYLKRHYVPDAPEQHF